MIYQNINSDTWRKVTIRKLLSFCEKCPVLLSTQTGYQGGEEGIFITHKNSGKKYFFPWNFNEDPKVFIHKIKEFLEPRHYPVLEQDIYEVHEFTPEELAIQIEKGGDVNSLTKSEERVAEQKYWRIDKSILWREIFILVEIDATGKRKDNKQYRYNYELSSVNFLKKYRDGEFKDIKEAGAEFFGHASLVSVIEPKDENIVVAQ